MSEKLPDMQGWTEQQVAEFLDQADLSEHEDEFEPVEVETSQNRREVVSLRIDAEDLAKVKWIAQHKGLGHTTLLRIWIKERLIESTTLNEMQSLIMQAISEIEDAPPVKRIDHKLEEYKEIVRLSIEFKGIEERLVVRLHPSQLKNPGRVTKEIQNLFQKALASQVETA